MQLISGPDVLPAFTVPPPLLRHGWNASTSSFCFWELAKASRALRACMLWINFQAALSMSSRPHGTQRTCECKDLYYIYICFKIGDSSEQLAEPSHIQTAEPKVVVLVPQIHRSFPFTMTKSGWFWAGCLWLTDDSHLHEICQVEDGLDLCVLVHRSQLDGTGKSENKMIKNWWF